MNKKKIIEFQLDRKLDVLPEIVGECPFSMPAVLKVVPFDQKRGVFPTIYWLSCPYLVKKVSQLEDRGLIGELTERLKKDDEFKKRINHCHRRYAEQRRSLLTAEDLRSVKKRSSDILEVLSTSGIGGIREKKGIKCLHAHLADYLINGENPVGEIIRAQLSWPEDCTYCAEGVKNFATGSN